MVHSDMCCSSPFGCFGGEALQTTRQPPRAGGSLDPTVSGLFEQSSRSPIPKANAWKQVDMPISPISAKTIDLKSQEKDACFSWQIP